MIDRIIADVRPYTGTADWAIEQACDLVIQAIEGDVPGDIVECGTWMGGVSFAMLLCQRYRYGEIRRPVWMFDSFHGMSPPTAEDGDHAAHWWESAKDTPKDQPHNDHCIAPLEHVRAAVGALGLWDHVVIRPGWLADTLKGDIPHKVAVLRVDCDWYEPVSLTLDTLGPRVSDGGAVIIDDYYAWEGAALATHEYLAKTRAPWPIKSISGLDGAYFIKEPLKW